MIDETNLVLMREIARHVDGHAPSAFGRPPTGTFKSSPISSIDIDPFYKVVDATLGEMYTMQKGPLWHLEKKLEMREPGLTYVWIENDTAILGFVLVKVVLDSKTNVLYLYEIHVNPSFQNNGIGKYLINGVHQLAQAISYPTKLASTCLTVFSDNQRALDWYQQLGYYLSDDSPVDKKLRSGIKRPLYYILEREVAV